jgi:chromosome segregation ATPase
MIKTTLTMPPPTADIPVLRRRLEAALRQIEGLKSLNANLEQQLIAKMTSLSNNTTLTGNNTSTVSSTNTSKNVADATAHAMIDALQLQMEAMGLMTRKSREEERKNQSLDAASRGGLVEIVPAGYSGNNSDHTTNTQKASVKNGHGPLERVVALWKQACATRDKKLEEAARRLQSAGIELGAKEAELAAMRQAAKALKHARNEAITAATVMEKRMREALSCRRSLESQLSAAMTGLGDRDLLRERISALEAQYNSLKQQAAASETRAVQAERALAGARATAVATSEQLRRCEETESRARAANERASEAENAFARHLESHSQQDGSTSLGKQLEEAWATERRLAQKLQEMQLEATEAKSELATAIKNVEMYAQRASMLQEQLNEAVGALAEQGAALDALQGALKEEKALRCR